MELERHIMRSRLESLRHLAVVTAVAGVCTVVVALTHFALFSA